MQRHALLIVPALALASAAVSAAPASDADKAFVDKVSQGGMYEVAASKLASTRASVQEVRDFAVAEVHDHTLVGATLGKTPAAAVLRHIGAIHAAPPPAAS